MLEKARTVVVLVSSVLGNVRQFQKIYKNHLENKLLKHKIDKELQEDQEDQK